MRAVQAPLAVLATVVVALTGLAAPAWAHEEINPKTFPTGQPTFFTLNAANEKEVNLTKIVLHAAPGVAFGESTKEPAGWTVVRTDDTITWSGGAVKPEHFEQWGYEVEGADQPGTLAYKVTLGFADGKSDDVEVDIMATAPGAAGSAAPSTTVTTAPVSSTTAPPSRTGESDSTSGTAKAALGIAIVALLVAAGALAVGARKRPAGPGAGGSGPQPAAQDW